MGTAASLSFAPSAPGLADGWTPAVITVRCREKRPEVAEPKYRRDVARNPSDVPTAPVVVVTNRDEDCSSGALRSFLTTFLPVPNRRSTT